MTYSLDFRQRVFRVKDQQGLSFEQTSKHFALSMRTLFRWHKSLEPKLTRNKPATKIDIQALKQDLQNNPERFQYERAQDYQVSQAAIFYALKRLNISRKKNAAPS